MLCTNMCHRLFLETVTVILGLFTTVLVSRFSALYLVHVDYIIKDVTNCPNISSLKH